MLLKDLNVIEKEQNLSMILNGLDYPMFVANKDKENYAKFKDGYIEDFSEETLRDMDILSLLEGFGYPMDELGTYLYKDVIVQVCNLFIGKDIDIKKILNELSNAYSQFYHDIAREDKDMGIRSFHLFIEQAIEKIDEQSIDMDLVVNVLGFNPEEMNYGIQAFCLASYVSNLYGIKQIYNKPKVLSKM